MHNHDRDLIMALAEETLEPDAAATARAEIASCAECSADLELQRSALQLLRAAPRVGLTELESTRLRRHLRDELQLTEAEPAWEPVRRRRLPLAALATAAAVLIGVVMVGPGLNLIGDSDSDDTIAAEAATTTAAAQAVPQASPDAAAEGGAEDVASDEFAARAEATTTAAPLESAAAPTTAAPGTTTSAGLGEEPRMVGYFDGEQDLEALRNEIENLAWAADASTSALRSIAGTSVLEESAADAAACIAVTISASDNYEDGFVVSRGELEGREVIYVVYLAEDRQESALIVQAADNCEELRIAGPR